jgi:hypothetical protein
VFQSEAQSLIACLTHERLIELRWRRKPVESSEVQANCIRPQVCRLFRRELT